MNDRYRQNDSPIVVDDSGMLKLIALVFIMSAVFGLLYLLTHSLEWSALIMLVAIATPAVVYLVTWIRVKDHQMSMDKARLTVEAQQYAHAQPSPAPRLREGVRSGTTWAPVVSSGKEMVTDFDHQGKRMAVSRAALEHFISTQFPYPNRERLWRMQDDDYRQAATFLCEIADEPLRHSGRTYVWKEGITQEIMFDWLSDIQAEASDTVNRALSVTE